MVVVHCVLCVGGNDCVSRLEKTKPTHIVPLSLSVSLTPLFCCIHCPIFRSCLFFFYILPNSLGIVGLFGRGVLFCVLLFWMFCRTGPVHTATTLYIMKVSCDYRSSLWYTRQSDRSYRTDSYSVWTTIRCTLEWNRRCFDRLYHVQYETKHS